MAASTSRKSSLIVDINVTPLVDVVLVLLVIFMVVTNIDDEKPADGIDIDLPGAATSQSIAATDEPFTVAVAADGRLVLKGRPATSTDVVDAVRAAISQQGPALEVVVSADRAARHERFVALLDLLRAEGVSRFAIQTDAAPMDG